MTKATYKAPEDDNAVVTMRGIRFFDGQPIEVEDEDLLEKLRTNQHFEVAESKPKAPKAPKAESKPKAEVDPNALKAVHIAGGRFVIKRGDQTITEGLKKSDADAFNALSPEDQEAYVA